MTLTTTTVTPTATFEIIDVDPETAAVWLDNMAPNRKPSQKRVTSMAKMMKTDLWIFDASPIRFDINGKLVDGQNRLHAVIEADMTVTFAVVHGVAPEAMAVMDTGKSRTFVDILQMAHPELTQTTSVSALTRLLYVWENGGRGVVLRSSASRGVIPNQVLLDFYDEHHEEIDAAVQVARMMWQRYPGISGTAIGLAYLLFARLDKQDADYFFERYSDGVGLEVGSPILALRKRAREAAMQDKRAAIPSDEAVALLVKAWNAFRDGNTVQILSWKRGGATPEAFPEPR